MRGAAHKEMTDHALQRSILSWVQGTIALVVGWMSGRRERVGTHIEDSALLRNNDSPTLTQHLFD